MTSPPGEARRWETGSTLLSLLLALVVIGVLAGVVLKVESGTTGGSSSLHLPSLPSGVGTPAQAGNDISIAAVDTCKADYAAVNTAVTNYEALYGHPPTNMSAIQTMLKDSAKGPGFQISIDPSGKVQVAADGHPSSPGVSNCAYA